MNSMFNRATSFNQDISGWNVGSVMNMFQMFNSATAFNQDISGWNVGSVTNMASMFAGATSFNQNLCLWKDAPAVIRDIDGNMFQNCPGGPKKADNSFDASQCVVSYFEK